ncbi:MAG: nitronate monooxygenase [Alphaproteobacteria bacterium]|nr:nitronate monooxygenase [Alphaproteobacteria bacterium]
MLKTQLCQNLGVEYPIFSAGLGVNLAGVELTAAVSNAGGCGVLGMGGMPADYTRPQIKRLRGLTGKPFGVNILLPLLRNGQIEACLDEEIPILVLFWGDPGPYVKQAHQRGVKVFVQVGSVEEAVAAADAGVDAIIAQGVEAGGHVKSTTSLSVIVPAVVAAVKPIPVIASGGIANGQGLVSALALGAQGVSMGTRFLCTNEANAAQDYKELVTQSRAEDTIYTGLFDVGWPNAPHRVLRNTAVKEWEAAGRPAPGQRQGESDIMGTATIAGQPVEYARYAVSPPVPDFRGDITHTALYAGESCALVHDIRPAAQIMQEMVQEAEQIITQLRK